MLVWYFWYQICYHQVIKKYIFVRQLKWNFWLLSEDNKLFKTVGVHTQWWLAPIEKSLESWLVVIYKNRVIKYNDIDFASVFYMILKFNIDFSRLYSNSYCVDLITDYQSQYEYRSSNIISTMHNSTIFDNPYINFPLHLADWVKHKLYTFKCFGDINYFE